ncbi:MAG: hypothetical protein H0Z38_08880 [Firmicutes bacterium]|nr:hypothetical protein [Bacillota bacterium]
MITRSVLKAGKAYTETVFAQGFEGVMAKKTSSRYLPGERTDAWLKIKNQRELVATIIGFTAPQKATGIDSLLLATSDPAGGLRYIGRVGTGLDTAERAWLLELLASELTPVAPVPVPPQEKGGWWVKPVYDCLVGYLEFTNEGILRHPVYKRLVQNAHR